MGIAPRDQTIKLGPPNADLPKRISHDEIASKLKLDYLYARKEQNHRILEGIQSLLGHFQKPHLNLNELLDEAANFIWRQFLIKEVTIGLRSAHDGLYRYETMVGLRNEIWLAHKSLSYRKEEFFSNETYKGRMISKYTKLLLAEDNPYADDESDTYDRMLMLESKRQSLDDTVEGDYFDVHIYGPNDDLLGWIEFSGTRLGKLPDASTLKAIETIGTIIGAAIWVHHVERGARS